MIRAAMQLVKPSWNTLCNAMRSKRKLTGNGMRQKLVTYATTISYALTKNSFADSIV